jgi:hypothetical protein
VQFTEESATTIGNWWLSNPGSVDQEQHDWHLDEVYRAVALIEENQWGRLRYDEDQSIRHGIRRIVHLAPPGLHLVIDLVVDAHEDLVADLVAVLTEDPTADADF